MIGLIERRRTSSSYSLRKTLTHNRMPFHKNIVIHNSSAEKFSYKRLQWSDVFDIVLGFIRSRFFNTEHVVCIILMLKKPERRPQATRFGTGYYVYFYTRFRFDRNVTSLPSNLSRITLYIHCLAHLSPDNERRLRQRIDDRNSRLHQGRCRSIY